MFCCKSHSNLIWDNKNQNNFECYCSTTFRHMINNRVVKSCFLRCFSISLQWTSSSGTAYAQKGQRSVARRMPRVFKGAWLGGFQEFSIEQHLLFLTIFLQLCSGQLDSPPHLKRNHPARETSASQTKQVPNFNRACKRQNKFWLQMSIRRHFL